jgi:hypothetical protein
MVWKYPASPVAKKFKSQPSFHRIMHKFWTWKARFWMEQPPYSPDLASSDFDVFGLVKEFLRGRRFSSDEEAIGVMQNWLKTQLKNFLLTELTNL